MVVRHVGVHRVQFYPPGLKVFPEGKREVVESRKADRRNKGRWKKSSAVEQGEAKEEGEQNKERYLDG